MNKKLSKIIILSVVAVVSLLFGGCKDKGHTHDYKESVIAPTCTQAGYTLYECDCGEFYKSNYINALGHVEGEWTTETPATCTENGIKVKRCITCKEIVSQTVLQKTGHEFSEWESDNNATEFADGTKSRHCIHEGCSETERVVDKGSKIQERTFAFKTLNRITDTYYKLTVPAKNVSVNFDDYVEVYGETVYEVSKKDSGLPTVSKIQELEEGKNIFYIVISNKSGKNTVKIEIYRNHVYTVTFDTDGGSNIEPQHVEEGELAVKPENPTKEGYTFEKWNYDFKSPINSDKTIKAIWVLGELFVFDGFSTLPINTSVNKTVSLNGLTVSDVNKYKLTYSLDKPVVCYITIGNHTENFFLEAGENLTFTSFTDDALGNIRGLIPEKQITDGVKFSGNVGLSFEPIMNTTVSFLPKSLTLFYQPLSESLITVQNERFKVGTHLYYGGALTYFEDLKDGDDVVGNLVNIHDGGRLIQQSYYADDTQSYGGAYNPVQGGNGYGYSKIIDYYVEGDTIYTKSRAKNWLCTNNWELSDSYMENWYTVYEDYVTVRNTFVDFVDSNNVSNSGECPAVYFVGGLDNFYAYTGTSSWTDGKLTEYKCGDGKTLDLYSESGYGHAWIGCSETWAAWVNDNGFGAGVYTPGAVDFIAWQANFSEEDVFNPWNNYTSYVAPHVDFTIRPFEKLDYTYMMTTGSVSEIRQIFKENKDFIVNTYPELERNKYDLTDLDFTDKQTLTFTTRYNQAAAYYDEIVGATKVIALEQLDPYFGINISTEENYVNAQDYRYITLEYMIPEECPKIAKNGAALYFGVGTNPWVDAKLNVKLSRNFIADGKWHTTYFDTGSLSGYTGRLNLIRFDFSSGDINKFDYYYVKHIRLTNTIPTDYPYTESYTYPEREWVDKGNESGKYYSSVDYAKIQSTWKLEGWILYNGGIDRFEYILAEAGKYSRDYVKTADAEKLWRYAHRESMRARYDASAAFPGVGDDGAQAGFNLVIPTDIMEVNKDYVLYVRAIGKDGKAILFYTATYQTAPSHGKFINKNTSGNSWWGIIDSQKTENKELKLSGWILCYEKIDHYETLICPTGYYEEKYYCSLFAEKSWNNANAGIYSREGVAYVAPALGDDGKTGGYSITCDLSELKEGASYDIYVRAVTVNGNYCYFFSTTYVG